MPQPDRPWRPGAEAASSALQWRLEDLELAASANSAGPSGQPPASRPGLRADAQLAADRPSGEPPPSTAPDANAGLQPREPGLKGASTGSGLCSSGLSALQHGKDSSSPKPKSRHAEAEAGIYPAETILEDAWSQPADIALPCSPGAC